MQAHSGPDQVLISCLKVYKCVDVLMVSGSLFHIFGPSDLREFDPYRFEFCVLTTSLFLTLSLLVLSVKISFIKGGLRSFNVLKISIASVLNFRTPIVGLFANLSRCS